MALRSTRQILKRTLSAQVHDDAAAWSADDFAVCPLGDGDGSDGAPRAIRWRSSGGLSAAAAGRDCDPDGRAMAGSFAGDRSRGPQLVPAVHSGGCGSVSVLSGQGAAGHRCRSRFGFDRFPAVDRGLAGPLAVRRVDQPDWLDRSGGGAGRNRLPGGAGPTASALVASGRSLRSADGMAARHRLDAAGSAGHGLRHRAQPFRLQAQ